MNNSPAPRTPSAQLSRRTVAAGLAWSVPTLAAVSAAPAFAVSPRLNPPGAACKLFYGTGTINAQEHSIFFGIPSTNGEVPAGTTVYWTITMSGGIGTGGANEVPTLEYSPSNEWTLTTDPVAGTVASSFTVTFVANRAIPAPSGTWCGPRAIWNTTDYTLRPGAAITISSTGSLLNPTTKKWEPASSGLSYNVAKRHPNNVNTAGRAPHVYKSKSGIQACYPPIQYSRVLNTNGTDNVTTYPAGVTPPGSRGTWDGKFNQPSATGQSSPAYVAGAASGPWEQPAAGC